MNIKKMLGVVGLSMLGVGCVSTHKTVPTEKWNNFNPHHSISTQGLAADQSMVVFLRQADAVNGPAVNIFVEGKYLTSLQAGGYKAVPMCAVPTYIGAAFTDVATNYMTLRQRRSPFHLEKGSISYFSVVQDSSQHVYLQPLNATQAQQAMQQVKEQTNTLPRLKQTPACPEVAGQQAEMPLPVVKKYTLTAKIPFAYSKAGPAGILQQGHNEIAAITEDIKKNTTRIGQIAVIGHTDPVGSDAFNQRLSLQRAETVRDLLVSQGLAKQNMLVEGCGEQELLVNGCEHRFAGNKLARDKCNEPNRRVEIVTYGLKEQ